MAGEAALASNVCVHFVFRVHSQPSSQIRPGVGITPIFYKIPVTADCVRHVRHGTYSAEPTVVTMHVPAVPRLLRRYTGGMKPLDNRQVILSCYEAFKGDMGIQSCTFTAPIV